MSGVQQRKRVQVSEEQARFVVGTCHATFWPATPEQNIHQGSEADLPSSCSQRSICSGSRADSRPVRATITTYPYELTCGNPLGKSMSGSWWMLATAQAAACRKRQERILSFSRQESIASLVVDTTDH